MQATLSPPTSEVPEHPSPEQSPPESPSVESSSDKLHKPQQMTDVLVTGGLGFIGSHLVRKLLQDKTVRVINLDISTYAAACGRRFPVDDPCTYVLGDETIGDSRHILYGGSVCNKEMLRYLFRTYDFSQVYHLAAETHVDRSITDPVQFTKTNVLGTQVLLEAIRTAAPTAATAPPLLYVSTDEVYGEADEATAAKGGFTEDCRVTPGNPYSATKAAAESLCLAYHRTYGLRVVITRGANTYGTHQYPEKFLPVMIDNAAHDRSLPLYGDGLQEREWLHVADHVDAILFTALYGGSGQIYNVSGDLPMTNLLMVKEILRILGKPGTLIKYVPDRPGHDRRYSIYDLRLADSNWRRQHRLVDTLPAIVEWYAGEEGQKWIEDSRHDTTKRLGV